MQGFGPLSFELKTPDEKNLSDIFAANSGVLRHLSTYNGVRQSYTQVSDANKDFSCFVSKGSHIINKHGAKSCFSHLESVKEISVYNGSADLSSAFS